MINSLGEKGQAFSITFMSGLLVGHSNGFSNFRSAGLGQGFGLGAMVVAFVWCDVSFGEPQSHENQKS